MGNLHGLAGAAPAGLSWRAVRVSALLSVLFLVVYGATNWLTSLRPNVPTWYFDWELAIPLVPIMIVPYMSIDLFFVAAPFLCKSDAELTTFARRVTFAIGVAGVCFLLMPLRLGFERQAVPGWLGAGFDAFLSMDAPHNLFPSLHIALRVLLADLYVRHARGLLKVLCAVWFVLIGLSTVLTHQHHLIDLAGGFVLGGCTLRLFREDALEHDARSGYRIGTYYAIVAFGGLIGAVATWPLGLILLWPSVAAAVVAAGYFGLGVAIFGKRDGRVPWLRQLALAPVLLGHHLSLCYYRRQCRAWDAVAPGVLLGRKLNEAEARAAVGHGVTAVVDLTGEFTEAASFRSLRYLSLPVLDLTAPTARQLAAIVSFIATEAATGLVYVHCKAGYSRSVAAVGAYLLTSGLADSVEEALRLLRAARPSIIVRPEVLGALTSHQRSLAPLVSPTRQRGMTSSLAGASG